MFDLLSDHLGLFIHLLAIGYITQEVMTFSSCKCDLLAGVFQTFFSAAPEDHLTRQIRDKGQLSSYYIITHK